MQITFAGNPMTLKGKMIQVGDKAPNFTCVKQDLSPYDFYQETEGKIKVLSIAPSLDTSVCELQTMTFNQEARQFKHEVAVVQISVDLPFAQSRFCGVKAIENLEVVSDHKDLSFGEQYGFVIEELRLLTRGVVIIDANNEVKYVEYVSEVTEHPNYEAVIEAVKVLLS